MASAAVLNVDPDLPDVLGTDGACSLREAIINANDDAATWPDCPAGTGDDEIVLSDGVFYANVGPVVGPGNLALVGAGAGRSVVDLQGSSCLFVAVGASLHLEGMTVQNGRTCTVQSEGALRLIGVTVRGTRHYSPKRCGHCGPGIGLTTSGIVAAGPAEIIDSSIVENEGFGVLCAACRVRNSTIAENEVGLFFTVGGSISHSTIADNQIGVWGSAVVAASIVADGCLSGVTSSGFNIESEASCGFTEPSDLQWANPLLGSLSSSPLPFIPLLSGSPAIDAVPLADCTEAADQRGVARPQGPACDIGAYERVPLPPGPTCGIGPELAVLVPLLAWARRTRKRAA